MLHDITGATGCADEDAMYILLSLYDKTLAEAYLLIYDKFATDLPPLEFRKLHEGFPQFPYVAPLDDRVIDSSDEVSYGFLFKLTADDIEITDKLYEPK